MKLVDGVSNAVKGKGSTRKVTVSFDDTKTNVNTIQKSALFRTGYKIGVI
ncbi:hypothetical protein [Hazenella coriacea]|nr:hypothetical protein [Hazenella coriacea]